MRFSSYQREVNPNTINTRVHAPSDKNAYGTGGSEWAALGSAIGQVASVVSKQQDQDDAADLMQARNEIMKRVNEGLYGEKGLFTTGTGTNAAGLGERTDDFLRQTYADVAKGYNGRVRYALQKNLDDPFANFSKAALVQETKEKQQVEEDNFNSGKALNAQTAAQTWDVPNSLTAINKDTQRLIRARGLQLGWGGEKTQVELRAAITDNVKSAAQGAISNGNIDRADEILRYNRTSMDQSVYNQLAAGIRKEKQQRQTNTNATNIFDQCFDKTTGRMDWEKARKLAHEAAYREVGGTGGGNRSNPRLWAIAKDTAARIKAATGREANPDFLYGQMEMESTHGEDPAALKNNNFAGLHGGAEGRSYSDDTEFAQDYANFYINNPQYLDAVTSGTATEFVDGIMSGGWFEDKSKRDGYIKAVDEYGNEGKGGSYDTTPNYAVAGANLDNLDSSFQAKVSALDNWLAANGGGHVTITSGNDGSHDDQNHYTGHAVDVVSDALQDDNTRAAFKAEAEKLGIRVYDEYDHANWTSKTTGENMHLSDTDKPMPQGGGAGGAVYDAQAEQEIMSQLNAMYGQRKKELADEKAAHIEDVQVAIHNAGDYTTAIQIIDGDNSLTPAEKLTLKNFARSDKGISSRGSGGGSYRGGGSYGGGEYRPFKGGRTGASGEHYSEEKIWNAIHTMDNYYEHEFDDYSFSDAEVKAQDEASALLKDIGMPGGGTDMDAYHEATSQITIDAWETAKKEYPGNEYNAALQIMESNGFDEEHAIQALDAYLAS